MRKIVLISITSICLSLALCIGLAHADYNVTATAHCHMEDGSEVCITTPNDWKEN